MIYTILQRENCRMAHIVRGTCEERGSITLVECTPCFTVAEESSPLLQF